jgi:ABC-type sugar transport system ATPase subunit
VADSILSLTGVRKAFGGVQALSNGALDLCAGQVTALIGENGAGKSTLVKIMTGVLALDAGKILFKGTPVRLASPAAAQRLGIAAIH